MIAPDGDLPRLAHYQDPKDAEDAIRNGEHGSPGTLKLYVVEAELTLHSVAERGWELRRPPDDPFED